MMKFILCLMFLYPIIFSGQTIGFSVPRQYKATDKFIFYLHGGVVTVLGDNAINQSVPEWGPYEYSNILDSLRRRGFHVISERRFEGIPDSFYVKKISMQIDTLLKKGVKPGNILVLGASAGWDIGIRVSQAMKNHKLKFILMGGCWPETYKSFEGIKLFGHFLSITEITDPHGTCLDIFKNKKEIKSFNEIILNTGLSHGFIYKGYKEWIDPVIKWFEEIR